MPCKVELAGWIAPLTFLAWLSVSAPLIVVNADMQQLKLLRTLEVSMAEALQALEHARIFSVAVSKEQVYPGYGFRTRSWQIHQVQGWALCAFFPLGGGSMIPQASPVLLV